MPPRDQVDGFPVLDGAWPVIGHLWEMHRRFPQLCRRGAAAHGPLFWIHGGPGARQLMCTHPSGLSMLRNPAVSTSFYAEGFGALLGDTLFAFDGDEHRRVRGMIAPAFTPSKIKRSDVLRIVAEESAAGVQRWLDARRIDVLAGTQEIALRIIFRIIGVPGQDVAAWRRHYGRFLLSGLPSRGRVRGPIFWVADRARAWLDERLAAIVEDLRRRGDTDTLVGAIANSRDEDGTRLDRDLVVANLRLLVLAGHETTASAMAWSVLHLAADPSLQRRLVEEARGDEDLVERGTDPERMSIAEAVFREALRMYPAVHSVIRRVLRPVDLEVGTIPGGALLNVPFVHLLRDPERFADPDRFDPDRFAERPRPGTIETAMFGGGPHFCLGYHIAIAEGTLFNLHLGRALARRGATLRLERAAPLPGPVYLPLSHPPRGLAVQFGRRAA